MKISHLGLAAFFETAKSLNMTVAADELAVTQSALSQRIKSLEDDLEVTLFLRDGKTLKLTEAGDHLLRYAQFQSELEDDVLDRLKGDVGELAGPLRIAAFSSVLRSVIIPSLDKFLNDNPKVFPQFSSHDIYELPDMLKSARADMVIMDYEWTMKGLQHRVLGHEEYVMIDSKNGCDRKDVYLDNAPEDTATESFFAIQNTQPKDYRRSFMGDVYGILEGVERGFGRAVMSRHIIDNNKKVRILKGYKKYRRPLALHHFKRPYYSRLFVAVREELTKNVPKYL